MGRMQQQVVIMGVAGCGKSSLAQAWAAEQGWACIEGDDFHSPQNVEKMRGGQALGDADRAGWLDALAAQMARQTGSYVLACSALKRSYRERLRQAQSGLRFVYLHISPAHAQARVTQRGGHYFHPDLVASQFAALESPQDEPLVLTLDALAPTSAWLLAMRTWLDRTAS